MRMPRDARPANDRRVQIVTSSAALFVQSLRAAQGYPAPPSARRISAIDVAGVWPKVRRKAVPGVLRLAQVHGTGPLASFALISPRADGPLPAWSAA